MIIILVLNSVGLIMDLLVLSQVLFSRYQLQTLQGLAITIQLFLVQKAAMEIEL